MIGKKKLIAAFMLAALLVFSGCASGGRETLSGGSGTPLFEFLDDPAVTAFAENFETNFPRSLSVTRVTVAGGLPETVTEENFIRAVYDALSGITVHEQRAQPAHTDDELIYSFEMDDGSAVSFCFQGEDLLLGDVLYRLEGFGALQATGRFVVEGGPQPPAEDAPPTPLATYANLSALLADMRQSDGSVYGHPATVYTPADQILFEEDEFYDVFITYVKYNPPDQGEVIAPRINFAFRGERAPFDVQDVDAGTDFQAQVYGYSDDGLGRYTFLLSFDRSYESDDKTARVFYADSGYPMVNFTMAMGRDANKDRATIRFSAARPEGVLFDTELRFHAEMEAQIGRAGRGFLQAGGADQPELYGAFNDMQTEQPALYCYTVDAEAGTVAVYSTDDVIGLVPAGSGAAFTPEELGYGITRWTATAAEDFTVRGTGADGVESLNSLLIQASPELAITGADVGETEILPGQHTDLYVDGTGATRYELYDAEGALLDSAESGIFDVSFAEPGAHRVYIYGVSQMGGYTKPYFVDFTVQDGGEAGIIGVEIVDEERLQAGEPIQLRIAASPGTQSVRVEDLTDHETGFLKPNKYEFGAIGEEGAVLLESDAFEEQDGARVFAVTLALEPGSYYLVAVGVAGGEDGGHNIFEVYVGG